MNDTTTEPAAEPVDTIDSPKALNSLSAEQAAHRATHIGGSEIACLFGCGYQTELELWLTKAEQLEKPVLEGEHIEAGIFLEDGIARWAAWRHNWNIRRVNRYIEHRTVKGWGASLDYEIVGHEAGAAPLEIKNVNWFAAREGWELTVGEEEAPLHIELQLQHQIGATGRKWGAIAANANNKLMTLVREPHQRTIDAIGEKIEKFWDSIARGVAPEPNPARDLATLKRLYPEAVVGKTLDLAGDADFLKLVARLQQGRQMEKEGKALINEASCLIFARIGDAEAALIGDIDGVPRVLTAKTTFRKGYVVDDTTFRALRIVKAKEEKKPSRKALAAEAAE